MIKQILCAITIVMVVCKLSYADSKTVDNDGTDWNFASGNVGIGSSVPTRKLDVAGGIRVGAGEKIYDADSASYYVDPNNATVLNLVTIAGQTKGYQGTASAPSFSFSTDTDTGIYNAGTNSLGIATGATERLRINSSGNLGIGTTAPQSKLSVDGGIYQSGGNVLLGLNSGNVGIGTVMPRQALEVNGQIYATASATPEKYALIRHDGTDSYWENTTGDMVFKPQAGSVRLLPADGGSVYVGFDWISYSGILDIFDGGSDNFPGFLVLHNDAGTGFYLWVDTAGNLRGANSKPADDDAGVVIADLTP